MAPYIVQVVDEVSAETGGAGPGTDAATDVSVEIQKTDAAGKCVGLELFGADKHGTCDGLLSTSAKKPRKS